MKSVNVQIDSSSKILDEIEYWEKLGFYHVSTKYLDRHVVELTFEGAGEPVAHKNAQYFLNFPDGTSSPLYIRRNVLDDED
jgi:hypothetical protein